MSHKSLKNISLNVIGHFWDRFIAVYVQKSVSGIQNATEK